MIQYLDMDLSKTPANTGYRYFKDQFDDEAVLYVFRKHPVVMRKGLVLGLFGPLIGVLPSAIQPQLGFGYFFGGLIVGFIFGIIILLPSWVSWYFSLFIVTNQRFIQIVQKGFFHRAVADIKLEQIQSISYVIAGLQQTLLSYGTIKIQTYIGDLIIHDVHHPGNIQNKLQSILRQLNITNVDFMSEINNKDNNEVED